MMLKRVRGGIGAVSVLVAALSVMGAGRAQTPPTMLSSRQEHVMVPMRDGKRLSAFITIPNGPGKWPVLFQQAYGDISGAGMKQVQARLAASGYVVAAANFRGCYQSEGAYQGYRALGWGKLKDGYDLCEWFAMQPWSNGKVGTFGGSQGGYAQNFLAVTRPPHLAAQFMTDTGLSLYQEGYRIGGTTRPERFKTQMDAVCRDPKDNRNLIAEWFRHPKYDDYWRDEDCALHFDRMNVPCFTLGSWFDFMNQGSVESFIGRQHRADVNSRGRQQLLIGPWLHGGAKASQIGDLTFPKNAAIDLNDMMLRWFDYHLKGIGNGVDSQPTVSYYVMGAVGEPGAPGNVWRTSSDWPVSHTNTSFYLQEGGGLSTGRPVARASATRFVADPLKPAEIPGRAFPGAKDARAYEAQKEVRTFTSPVLESPLEWTGKVETELFVTSNAPDTDFIVRVSDVYPDGRSILLVDYVRRARYRDGFEKELFMTEGEIYRVRFQVGWLSQVFNKGHRIRVTVASTGAPFYEPNPNTGEPLTVDWPAKSRIAENSVLHDRAHASRIIAPVAK